MIKPQNSKVSIPIPRTKLKKTRRKKHIPSPKTENNTIEDKIIKDLGNIFMLQNKSKTIKDKIIRDIRTLLESEGFFKSEIRNYYKSVKTDNAFSNNSIEYKCNGDKN